MIVPLNQSLVGVKICVRTNDLPRMTKTMSKFLAIGFKPPPFDIVDAIEVAAVIAVDEEAIDLGALMDCGITALGMPAPTAGAIVVSGRATVIGASPFATSERVIVTKEETGNRASLLDDVICEDRADVVELEDDVVITVVRGNDVEDAEERVAGGD